MIFTGDIAVPTAFHSEQLNSVFLRHANIFAGQDLICNLEGLITDKINTNHKTPVLYNHSSVTEVLKDWKFRIAALANNHTLDLPEYFNSSVDSLLSAGIEPVGAGRSKEMADRPAIISIGNRKTIVFNHCWHVMLQHQNNPGKGVYVSTINADKILKAVADCRSLHPDANIVVYMHWSFDLELLPFPLYRQLSRTLIDSGANVVVGCHSHCPQGAEAYKDGYIVYGLGNFFVPWYTFINGSIHFPEFARVQTVFDWNPENNKARLHWFRYLNKGRDHTLEHLATEDFGQGSFFRQYSPFSGMDDKTYLEYFRKNRRKKGGIPVYRDYKAVWENRMIDTIIIGRIRLARFMAKYKLREWNN